MKKSRVLGVLILILASAPVSSGTITYSGSDLYNDPNVSFPTLQPTLSGTSLVFGTGSAPYSKLLVLPLFPAGTLDTTSPTTISVSINFTRLACVTSFGCAGGIDDSDHNSALGDGSILLSGAAADGFGGTGTIRVYGDLGITASPISSQIIFTNAGYPPIGSAFDVNLLFTLDNTTTLDMSFLGGSALTSDIRGLDRSAAIDFVFLSENDAGEQHQINSITISSPAIPSPPIPIAIDIKPGSDPNSINVSSSGVIPVAILSTADFDATTVDRSTVSLAGASVKLVGKSEKELCHYEDVNADGLDDLVCQVYTAQFMVEPGDTTAILEAYDLDGMKLRGEDSIRIVPDI